MRQILIDVRGRILRGRGAGQFLTVEDQTEQTGGYLIVLEPDYQGKNGSDVWVEKANLARAFEEIGWEVPWTHD
jgi:hypothetical protein